MFLKADLSFTASFATPVPAILKVLNVSRTEVVRFTQCFHVLVHAQRRWHARVARDLVDGRWTPMVSELCVVVLRDESGKTREICTWHVEDFLIAGRLGDDMCQHEFKAIRRHYYECSDWPIGRMEQCGMVVNQNADVSSTLDLSHYLAEVQPISVALSRCQTLVSVASGSGDLWRLVRRAREKGRWNGTIIC